MCWGKIAAKSKFIQSNTVNRQAACRESKVKPSTGDLGKHLRKLSAKWLHRKIPTLPQHPYALTRTPKHSWWALHKISTNNLKQLHPPPPPPLPFSLKFFNTINNSTAQDPTKSPTKPFPGSVCGANIYMLCSPEATPEPLEFRKSRSLEVADGG